MSLHCTAQQLISLYPTHYYTYTYHEHLPITNAGPIMGIGFHPIKTIRYAIMIDAVKREDLQNAGRLLRYQCNQKDKSIVKR